MNLASLQTFLTVVQCGNLNKAADLLNVTQSTVTARLDTLEDAVGQPLLVRSRKGAQLTKAGFAFQRHAELAVGAWEQGRKVVGLPKGFSGLFSFACHSELWDGLGEKWLNNIRQNQPNLALEAWPGESQQVEQWLQSGLVDAALTQSAISGSGLEARELERERLVQVASVARKATAWDPAYIYVDLGPEFRRWHTTTWPGDNTAHLTLGSSQWALHYLLSNGGSAYLPWRIVAPWVEEERLFLVEGSPEFSRPIHLTWREVALEQHAWGKDLQLNPEAAQQSGLQPAR